MSTTAMPPVSPVVSVDTVALPAPYRGQDLTVRVTAPATGAELPAVVFAHGFTLSSRDYAPVAQHWASRGFVVVQPTFLDSASLALAPTDSRQPNIWRLRVQDMRTVLDEFDLIEQAVPGLADRVDRTRVAAAGHSYGATTAGMLLGQRVLDETGEPGESLRDPRFTVGALLADPGTGDSLTPLATQYFPFMNPDFSEQTAPAFVAAGDADQSPLSTRGGDWFEDVYRLAPGADALLTVFGGEHSLGGINGFNDSRTTDENPARADLVLEFAWAYLLAHLTGDDSAWARATADLGAASEPLGRLETK
ncbi:alpha/beta hydrolase family protein [Amnibacterium kyonggiense]|uniref:Chlorophyllase-like protein n=1 Tax=Amnibacterium kyonggiense TaxID=595671 RepID=A0A4R7FR76_9MICO|nr:alpha/beta fold hydrolase [Amnibacterium kyonggiense]TDS80307.1 chlorophyllase-like protein [Amnibacterium kyonggiense]